MSPLFARAEVASSRGDVGWLTEMSLGISTKAEFASNNWLAANGTTIRRRHDSLMDHQSIDVGSVMARPFHQVYVVAFAGKKK